MRKLRSNAFGLLVILWPAVVWPAPDDTSIFLVNEPVSLMDLGLLRMELELAEFNTGWSLRVPKDLETPAEFDAWAAENDFSIDSDVSYAPGDDALLVIVRPIRILQSFGGNSMPPIERQRMINWCKWTIEDLKSRLNAPRQFERWFSHYFTEPPKNLGAQLISKVQLYCLTPLYPLQLSTGAPPLCRSGLTEDAIYCSEE